jgi:nucleoid-associated protein YgaU
MWRGEDRQSHRHGHLPMQETNEHEAQGLPPRRLRHRQKRYPITALLGSGLVLFGALFFGIVAAELYQAQRTPQTAVADQAPQTQLPSVQPLSPVKSVQPKENPQASVGMESSLAKETVSPPPAAATSAVKPDTGAANTSAAKPDTRAANASAVKPAPPTKQPPAAPAKPRVLRHVVKKGETLYQLSRKYYGHPSGVHRIARYNGFGTEHELSEGEVVFIPLSQ